MNKHEEMEILIFLASIMLLVAVYFSFKLSKETHHEKYWLAIAVGFLVFSVHHWMMIPLSFGFMSEGVERVIEQVSSIVSSLLFVYATHGLYTSMKEINKKTE